jgi:hypothetical protein
VDFQIFLQKIADRPVCYPKVICMQITQGNDALGIQIMDDGQIDSALTGPDVAWLSPGIRYAVSIGGRFWFGLLA